MAKKELKTFKASIKKNREKGGAWLCALSIANELGNTDLTETTAWSNASAAKRHAKARVKELTPRKSISFLGSMADEKEKPTVFTGTIQYKV
jgi:hypothetical protein